MASSIIQVGIKEEPIVLRTGTHEQAMWFGPHRNITIGEANRAIPGPEFVRFFSLLRKLILTHTLLYLGSNILQLDHYTFNQCIAACDML